MDMTTFLKYRFVYIGKRHDRHRTLISYHSTVFAIIQYNRRPRRVFIGFYQHGGIHSFGFEALSYQITESVLPYHSHKAHFCTQRGGIGGKNSSRASQRKNHIPGKFLFPHFGLSVDIIQNQIDIQLPDSQNIVRFHSR